MSNIWRISDINLNTGNILNNFLKNRIINENEVESYLHPNNDNLIPAFLFQDMSKIIDRIYISQKNNEKICIYGDYDVDGISSVSILLKSLRRLNINTIYYIPKRIEEGYGLSIKAIERIKLLKVNLIITVDCGITSIDEVKYANSLGLDMIITDHHECTDILPDAFAILNPKINSCLYPFKKLCGAGIALKLAQALISKIDNNLFMELIEISAIATIADIVELTGENRTIVKCGLESLKKPINIGLKSLMETSGINFEEINSTSIGYILAPRINSTGRMGHANLGVELLISTKYDDAILISRNIELLNKKRQNVELKIYEEALEIVESQNLNKKVLVLASKNWHSGVIGIVASKITEKYNKPTFIIAIEDDSIGKGSARSVPGFDLFKNICKLDSFLLKYGGHEQAAGITINESNISNFDHEINLLAEDQLESISRRIIYIDSFIKINEINFDLYETINLLEPFGLGNKKPVFCLSNVRLLNYKLIGKNKNHIKGILTENIDIIGFNKKDLYNNINFESAVDIVFEIDKNTFNNITKIQLQIIDIKNSIDYLIPFKIIKEKINSNITHLNTVNKFINYYDYILINIDNLLKLEGNKIIICSDPISYINMIKILFYLNIEPVIEINSDINEYTIILLPIVDNLNLSRYNNIIISSYNSNYLLTKKLDNFKLNSSLLYNMLNIDIIPNRSVFVYVYKFITKEKNMKLNLYQFCTLHKLEVLDFLFIIEIFAELGFLNYSIDSMNKYINILINKQNVKKELNKSKKYNILKNYIEFIKYEGEL